MSMRCVVGCFFLLLSFVITIAEAADFKEMTAAKLLESKYHVGLETSHGPVINAGSVEEMTGPDGEALYYQIIYTNQQNIDAEFIENLQCLSHLQEIFFNDCFFDPNIVFPFDCWNELYSLDIGYSSIENSKKQGKLPPGMLEGIAASGIKNLTLEHILQDEEYKYIAKMPKLKSLTLRSLNDEQALLLQPLKDKLQYLDIQFTNISADTAKLLRQFTKLKILLINSNITEDRFLYELSKSSIQYLMFFSPHITDEWLQHFSGKNSLKSVYIPITPRERTKSKVTDQGIDFLMSIDNIEFLTEQDIIPWDVDELLND